MKTKINSTILLLLNFLLQISLSDAQCDHASNVSTSGSALAQPLGWNSGTSNDLDIVNRLSGRDINFHTDGGAGLSQRMTIFANGKVRINTTSVLSLAQFEVDNDINLSSIHIL